MAFDVVRAWKDEAYRRSLSAEERVQLPENPAGSFELSERDLESVYGALGPFGNGPEANLSQYGNCSNAAICRQSVSGTNSFACFSQGFGSDCTNVGTQSASGTGNIIGGLLGGTTP
ncbi:MAG: mersacidin/lichenicidin family type 2 lantibiotic [Ktedonobacteraceae bacterium]|nr:mersacidin/lichenicidin family type 2 lantibiotic [Ktedonobacteraceae bacterium]